MRPQLKSTSVVIGILVLVAAAISLSAQPYGEPDTGQPGDAMIQAFLAKKSSRIHDSFLDGVETKADWLAKRDDYREEYLHMLGLSPPPDKTPLEATKTGSLVMDGYTVEMLHYQSIPGLYVTGNLYRPSNYEPGEKFPTILYVCGHGPRGRNGNKTAYQSHAIWYAKHGYICLVVDTLQMGEIPSIHHGTYRENRWWWHSRGYTSAGVECWNGIRGIDYLISRPDVDPERIGVTGRSGGGAVTFWIAAIDERVKAASSVSGMADLPAYVNNRVINGHCDCMFFYNTYQWPWARIGGLIAPRPLLFVNGDADAIFPMDANNRVINRLESIYSLFGAGDQVDSVVSKGGHSSREDIRKATYRFMNIHLKNDPSPVLDSEVDLVTGILRNDHPIPPEKLRVFPNDSDLPRDELNTTIDQHFVPLAKSEVPSAGGFNHWRTNLITQLREVTFRGFPSRIPAALLTQSTIPDTQVLETEAGIKIELRTPAQGLDQPRAKRIVLVVNSETNGTHYDSEEGDIVYVCDPRGVGNTRWTRNNPPNYVERSHVLLGRTVNDGRIWDIIATARYIKQVHGGALPLFIAGHQSGAVLAAYATLLEEEIDGAILIEPPASHMEENCPPLLNVLRVCDIPQIIGALAPKPIHLKEADSDLAEFVATVFKVSGKPHYLKID